jgi:hypothetical protein
METGDQVRTLVDQELARIADSQLRDRIRTLLVAPARADRDWHYGAPGDTYPCWTVLEDSSSDTAIVFCSQGFGPAYPWGVVRLSNDEIGSDDQWFLTLEDAMRCSPAWRGENPADYEVQ